MTKEQIEKIAEYHGIDSLYRSGVVDFANEIYQLGRKHGAGLEREECANIADEWVLAYPHPSKTIAETIRARGQE